MKKYKVNMIVKQLESGTTRTKVLLAQPPCGPNAEHPVYFTPPMLAVTVMHDKNDPFEAKNGQKMTVELSFE
jgi:hypothetical protein